MKIVSSLVVALLLANCQEIQALRLHANSPMGDSATATKENQPIIITPSSFAPPPAPAAPTPECAGTQVHGRRCAQALTVVRPVNRRIAKGHAGKARPVRASA